VKLAKKKTDCNHFLLVSAFFRKFVVYIIYMHVNHINKI
jgi:hypothetical protein